MPADTELRLAALVRAHDRWRSRGVFNLLPSENAVSPTARQYLSSDLAGRYTLPMRSEYDGEVLDNSYAGTRYTDEIEQIANAAAARVFRGGFATTRPLSGHIAALSAIVPLLPPKSRLIAVQPDEGGYDGYAPGFIPAVFGYTMRPLPATGPGHSVRLEEAVDTIRRERPNAVILGQSYFLFPYPLREIAEEAHAHDALVLYDASHVLGLIAGGGFQDPLKEGADVLYGSTHKSFFGPQGGLLVTNRKDLFEQIDSAVTWRLFDNAHWNRIAALGQTLLEFERVGADYARTVVANSKALGAALASRQVPLIAEAEGFTESHQLLIDRKELRKRHGLGSMALSRRLERQRLLLDLIGRVGSAEITRLGLTPPEMDRMADLLVRGGINGEKVGPEVLRWRREYRALRFA